MSSDDELPEMEPRSYYDSDPEAEWERLDANPVGRLEFESTVTELREHLPAKGRVLDAGGGPGRYSGWLAEQGYEAIHCDLSGELTRYARARTTAEGTLPTAQADVRALPYRAGSFDAVCCLGGVLSHVVDVDERAAALAELKRVARTGAPVFVSVIGLLSALRYQLKHALGEHDALLTHLAASGDYTAEAVAEHADGEGWAECHFFRVEELEVELRDAGYTVERSVGLEGIASNFQDELSGASEASLDSVREAVDATRRERSVADFSEHFLTIARA